MELPEQIKKINSTKALGITGVSLMIMGYILLVTKQAEEGASSRQMIGLGVIIVGGMFMLSGVMMKSNKNLTDAIASASAASKQPAA